MTTATERPAAGPGETAPGDGWLVLASASPARRSLLEAAGLEFEIIVADIDERLIRDELLSKGRSPGEIAQALAGAKAKEVAARLAERPDDRPNDRPGGTPVIIGADQILLFEGEIYEKPADLAAARETLKKLRGKTHELITAAAGYRAGRHIWSCLESAHLTMRDFSDDFLEAYLRQDEGQLASVGAYRIEGRGAQLFSHIEGDFFTVLGLPLLPLLDFLRREKLLLS